VTGVARIEAEERLLTALSEGTWDIGTLWEFCAHFEWADRTETVDAICAWLGPPDGSRILDCACGSGFPAIELARRGYRVACSDGSASMLAHLCRNLQLEGLSIPWAQVRWEWLGHLFPESFDVIMCRGASFPYAGTWDTNATPDRGALDDSIRQFAASLRPGGRLYLDTIRAADLARAEPQLVRHPTLAVGAHRIDLDEVITNQPDRGLRIWHARITVDGTSHEFTRRSHFLTADQLTGLMTAAGLVEVRQVRVSGEHYEVYTAIRPEC
jgi:SAM-dependent methyltransferase